MKNLIFIEGVSGAGKSTTTRKLCEKLQLSGYTVDYYLEGNIKSPLDSFWNAYLTKAEYENVRLTYPDCADELSKNCIVGEGYALVRYRDFERQYYSPEIYEYLKKREFCYNPVRPLPHVKYTEVFSDLWKRFAKSEQTTRDFVIFDGSFLHHQINDLIRNYNASDEDIIRHLTEMIRAVGVLNPIIFYLSPQDVGEQLRKAWDNRGKTAPTKRDIDFWRIRKYMDLRILERLSVKSHVLGTTNNNWDSVPDTILMRITKAKV